MMPHPLKDAETGTDTGNVSLSVAQGDLLWTPTAERVERSNLFRYTEWLEHEKGHVFEDYQALWTWSVEEVDTFWASLWEYFQVDASRTYNSILSGATMPEAVWFEGARLNFCQHLLRHEANNPDRTVIHAFSETGPHLQISWAELGSSVRSMATALRNLGIKPGDRIVSYLPNIPETAIMAMAVSGMFGR